MPLWSNFGWWWQNIRLLVANRCDPWSFWGGYLQITKITLRVLIRFIVGAGTSLKCYLYTLHCLVKALKTHCVTRQLLGYDLKTSLLVAKLFDKVSCTHICPKSPKSSKFVSVIIQRIYIFFSSWYILGCNLGTVKTCNILSWPTLSGNIDRIFVLNRG